ncbi:unnamed protein product [Pieris macdunnoughi]|uniref:Uncharacterized protein n=1 Tax=Pieris macdunnoughi TaxID=345717 RepID=A0A821L2V4_9NEOP|nr:unnamed protein product [Pieris macdunnoughi]
MGEREIGLPIAISKFHSLHSFDQLLSDGLWHTHSSGFATKVPWATKLEFSTAPCPVPLLASSWVSVAASPLSAVPGPAYRPLGWFRRKKLGSISIFSQVTGKVKPRYRWIDRGLAATETQLLAGTRSERPFKKYKTEEPQMWCGLKLPKRKIAFSSAAINNTDWL